MSKKILLLALFVTMLFVYAPQVLAAGPEEAIQGKIDNILPPTIVEPVDERSGVAPPTSNLKFEIIPKAINIFLAMAGTMSFIVFVYAGVMLIIAQGNEEEITKFKNVLIWSIVGLLLITAAYALVRGIMNLVFT